MTGGIQVHSFGVDEEDVHGSAVELEAHLFDAQTQMSKGERALHKALLQSQAQLQASESSRARAEAELRVLKLIAPENSKLADPGETIGPDTAAVAAGDLKANGTQNNNDPAEGGLTLEEHRLTQIGVHGQSYLKDWVFYGAKVGQCVGNWSQWSSCMSQCYQLRKFFHVCTGPVAVPAGAKLRLASDGVTVKSISQDLDASVKVGATKVRSWTPVGGKKLELFELRKGGQVPELDLSQGGVLEVTPVKCDDKCHETYHMPLHGQLDYRQCKVGACKGMSKLKDDSTSLLFPIETQHIYNSKVFITNLFQPICVFWVFIILAVGWVQNFDLAWMPDAGVVYILCIAAVMTVKFAFYNGIDYGLWLDEILSFLVEPLLYLLLLPISIFEGGYNIQRKNFYSQFGYGCAFAIIGTLASAFGLAALIVLTGPRYGHWHEITSWREALVYSAFIADLDPVATLAAFAKLKVDPLLSTLVGGEATLNDPVAIIMFGILNSKSFDPEKGDPGKAVGEGLLLLVLSMIMGVLIGMALAGCQRLARIRGDTTAESLFTILSAYALFGAGELASQSGIIVCLFGGLVMGVYSRDNIQHDHQDFVCNALGVVARLADSGIFMVVGLCVFTMTSFSAAETQQSGLIFGLITMFFCMIVRAIVTALMVPPMNLVKKMYGDAGNQISAGTAVMIWHSQQRGGITLMMALMIDSSWCHNAGTLVDATITVCVGFCFLIGLTCPMMLKLCNVPMGVDQTDGTLGVQEQHLGRLEQLSTLLRRVLCHADAEDHAGAIQAGGRAQQETRSTRWKKLHTAVKLTAGLPLDLAKEQHGQ